MKRILKKNFIRELRQRRVRAKIFGTAKRPRLSVFRSNKYVWVQVINDDAGQTLASASTKGLKTKTKTKTEQAAALGELLAEKAKKAGIKSVIFDRGSYKYHGRIKSLMEAFLKHLK